MEELGVKEERRREEDEYAEKERGKMMQKGEGKVGRNRDLRKLYGGKEWQEEREG